MVEPSGVPGGSLCRLMTPRVGVGGADDLRDTFIAFVAVTKSAEGRDSSSGSDGAAARGDEPNAEREKS
jgi:hypothetical protein